VKFKCNQVNYRDEEYFIPWLIIFLLYITPVIARICLFVVLNYR
jgi:hypothetical protein